MVTLRVQRLLVLICPVCCLAVGLASAGCALCSTGEEEAAETPSVPAMEEKPAAPRMEAARPEPAVPPVRREQPEPPRAIEPAPVDRETHQVRRGECLWVIAGETDVYDDPWQWPRLYYANKDKIADPDLIYPDQELAIPSRMEYSVDYPEDYTP